MVAIRDIEPGEELVMNYAFMEIDVESFECKCGTASCRKVIDSNTWQDSGFQKKYGKYYSPYLKEKFEN